jgi:transposase
VASRLQGSGRKRLNTLDAISPSDLMYLVVHRAVRDMNVEILYLSSYSPNLNLIERLWRFFKGKVLKNHYYETFTDFVRAIKQFFTNPSDYMNELRSLMVGKFTILECI